MSERFRNLLVGGPRNLRDPNLHRQMVLIAFFAWVGLGADGLSSSSYGPEEAFLTLGAHTHLALYLAVALIFTVFLISASYSQIIELFPSGGGGYLVATRLLSPTLGVVSGCALVIDYTLTIATSVASGCEAIFSFLPPDWSLYKPTAEFGAIIALTMLNLRGVRESVAALIPIFVAFIATHIALIAWGILSHGAALGHLTADTVRDTHAAVRELGTLGVLAVFLKAFSLGGGTFTGIEAVSNGVQILREPRVHTARKTMLYMAASLSFTAGGIMLCYLLNGVTHQPGQTLNASLWGSLTRGWHVGGLDIGPALVVITLVSEGALLFVAAQTGFIDGPRTLSVMAVDRWVPTRFAHLSERLVTQNGVLLIGLAGLLTLAYTGGSLKVLIVMYSINVFITFTLSQLGMVRHWWQSRRRETHWRRRFGLALLGSVVTGTILMVTTVVKFREGGWVTLTVTAAFVGVCMLVHRHYARVRRLLSTLDDTLTQLPLPEPAHEPELARDGPTAVICVSSYGGLGIHTLLSVQRLLPRHFKNMVFVSVGVVDSGQFKGADSLPDLEAKVRGDLEQYVRMARRMSCYAEYRYLLGTDVIAELETLCADLVKEFRGVTVFVGQLVFQRETVFTRTMHQETADAIQRRLQFRGIQVVILPIRVWERRKPGPKKAA
jgi:amino acid transporter